MRQIENIGTEARQRFTLILDDGTATLIIYYLSPVGRWFFDVSYGGIERKGIKMAVGVLHIGSANFPFDFVVEDTSGEGIDPFQLSDFNTGRCKLYRLTADEMFAIRGVEVPTS